MKTLVFPIVACVFCCGLTLWSGNYLAAFAYFVATNGYGYAEYYRRAAIGGLD